MKKLLLALTALTFALASATLLPASPADASHGSTQTTTVQYGPYTIPGASGGQPSMLENQLELWTTKPCVDCYITGIAPDLVYEDGTTANLNTGAMLHHIVLASQFKADATCSTDWLGLVGERFFASGNERTVVELPEGYGYKVDFWDQWNLVYDLMNMGPDPITVYVELEVTYKSSFANVDPVRPVWLDIDQCGDSEYSIPAGSSDDTWDWNVNRPGDIVAIGGHVHDEGVRIEAVNQTTGQSICDSVAGYGESPEYIDLMGNARISSMSRCIADPVATVSRGQTVRMHSIYDTDEPHDDVMGIMIAFIA